MNPQTISLTELQKHLDQTCKEKGWDKNSVTEVFLFKGEKKPDNHDNLREEFADVLNYLMELANRFDVNLAEVYFEKHKINQTRQWK